MGILNFRENVNPRIDSEKKRKKINTLESLYGLFEGREKVLDVFKSGVFPLSLTKATLRPSALPRKDRVDRVSELLCLKISSSKQILQRLPIVLAQVRVDSTSETH